jgi:alpha-L-rhamnosidase
MKNWVEWIYRQDEGGGGRRLWTTGFHFGDWPALDGPGGSNPMGGTDADFLASAFYKLSSEILAKAANVLGRGGDAAYYGALSEQVRQAILDEFFTKSGRIAIKTQTALVVALHFRLAPDEMRGRVFNDLVALLKKDNMHLKTGFIGTPYLCRVLSENGAPELAYRILLQEDYPGWLYAVKLGATTIWERWNSLLPDGTISDTGMNSLNHYSYGSIVEWIYRHMCGIQPLEAYPGFVKFLVKPEIYGGFRYAKARVRTAAGLIESGWDLGEAGECVTINVNVPFGAEAEIYLPDADIDEINAGGYGCAAIKSGSHVRLTAPAGSYMFRYRPAKNYALRYSHETPLAELLASPEARQALADVFPHLPGAGDGRMPYSIASMDPGMQNMVFGTSDFTALDERLAKIRVPIRIV